MARIVDAFFHVLKAAIAVLLALMVTLVFVNVVLRYVANQGITSSEEVARLAFLWLTFLGAVVVLREHGHIGVDTLVRRLPAPLARVCLVVSYGLMLFADALLVKGSWAQAAINLSVGTPATGLSMALFYGAGLAFGVPAALILAWDLGGILSGRTDIRRALVRDSEDEVGLDELAGGGALHPAPAAAPPPAGKR